MGSILSPIVKSEVIDIYYNPGHSKMTYNTWLMSAPQMWFSKEAWKYFDKEKVQSFPEAIRIEEIKDNLVYVHLFDIQTEDYETEQILGKQARFREWSGMNKVEKELDAICESKNQDKSRDSLIVKLNITPTIETKNVSGN